MSERIQFTLIWMAMPWVPILFFGFELAEIGWLGYAALIGCTLSALAGVVAYRDGKVFED